MEKKTTSGKTVSRKRKSRIALEEYWGTFLQVPKIIKPKTVFISEELRDRLDRVVRCHGGRGMSASGFIENLLRHHLDAHEKDFEAWRKL